MRLRLKEDYESDMIAYNQAMDEYNLAMADYNAQMKDYNKTYKDWSANNPRQIYKQLSLDMKKTANAILLNDGINKGDSFIMLIPPYSFSKKVKSPLWAGCQVRIYNEEGQYDNDSVSKALTDVQQALAAMCANSSIVVDSRAEIKYWGGDPDSGIIYLSYTYQFVIPQNTLTKPVKPIKPSNITKPTMPKNPDADYEVKKRAYYDPADDIDYLFYELADNTIPNIEQKLKQAKWISGYDIYIPKGTQFILGPDKWVGGGDYLYESIEIVGGPLDGLRIPFLECDDDLCRDTFIRKYCKRI